MNQWLYESTARTYATDVNAQCQHKVAQDFAVLQLSVNQRQPEVEVTRLVSSVDIVAETSVFGKKLLKKL